VIGALLAVWALLDTPVPGPAPDAEPILAFADDLLIHGDPERAADEYTRYLYACGDCSRAPYAAFRLAEAYRRAGSPARAAIEERALVAHWPQAPEAREAARDEAEDLERAGNEAASSDAHRTFAIAHPGDPSAREEAREALRTALRAHDSTRVGLAVPLAGPEVQGLPGDLASSHARHRSMIAAGVLAALLPGAGHAYAGEWSNAFTAFATNALFLGGTAIAAQRKEYAVAGVTGGLELFWYGGNVIGAVNAAERFDLQAENARWKGLEGCWLGPATVSFRF
jgi:hypothetical protein